MLDLPWAVEIIGSLGAAGGPIFAVLWWIERMERKGCQAKSLEAARDTADALEEVAKSISGLKEWNKESAAALTNLMNLVLARMRDR